MQPHGEPHTQIHTNKQVLREKKALLEWKEKRKAIFDEETRSGSEKLSESTGQNAGAKVDDEDEPHCVVCETADGPSFEKDGRSQCILHKVNRSSEDQ